MKTRANSNPSESNYIIFITEDKFLLGREIGAQTYVHIKSISLHDLCMNSGAHSSDRQHGSGLLYLKQIMHIL